MAAVRKVKGDMTKIMQDRRARFFEEKKAQHDFLY
jgi:hypothetical protein